MMATFATSTGGLPSIAQQALRWPGSTASSDATRLHTPVP
jgi:hypothetical protein